MEDREADLRLAMAHVREVEVLIADQRSRLEKLREQGSSTDTAERLLAAFLRSHDLLMKHLAHVRRLRRVPMSDDYLN
jgi:hypothetical protein